MSKPQTLQELRDFFDSIPEDKWCRGKRGLAGTDVHCAFGHMIAAFNEGYELCASLKITAAGLIHHNDYYHAGPKAGVLHFLDKHINECSTH